LNTKDKESLTDTKKETRYIRIPSKEYRFYLYDPEGEGMTYFKTKEDRDSYANYCLTVYCDPTEGWHEEVEFMSRGEITEFPQCLNKQERPSDSELDEENCDSAGICWNPDWVWIGNYTWECVENINHDH